MEMTEQSTRYARPGQDVAAAMAPAPAYETPLSSADEAPCPHCAGRAASEPDSYVYAAGQIEARFRSLGVEKEFAQVTGRSKTAGATDQQVFHDVLSNPDHRYLARQMCWVLTVQGLDTYVLYPRDPADYGQLVAAIRPVSTPNRIDCVIGLRGPIAPPEACNGLMAPTVAFDQIYSFDRDALVAAIPCPPKIKPEAFTTAAGEIFDRILQMTDNAGSTDEHRALNYLCMRYPAIYAKAAEAFARDFSLTCLEVRPSPLSSSRRILDVIFSYSNRSTDFLEKYFVRVDATEEFPFLVTKLAAYYDR